jgi:SAM-dependent methyltransferase
MYPAKHAYNKNEATAYSANREKQLAWHREFVVIDKLCRKWLRGSTILDLPCGQGRLFPVFQRYGHQIWGGDISMDMLQQISFSHGQIPTIRGLVQLDAERLPFTDDSFDYVVSARFFHWGLPIEAAKTILREYTRIARKGIVLHGPLNQRGVVVRVADAAAEIIHRRWGAPVELARQTKEAAGIIQRRLGSKLGRSANSHPDIPAPIFTCTSPELEEVVGQAGFSVTQSYGAISPFSSKRIYFMEKNNS